MKGNILHKMFNPNVAQQWTSINQDFSVDLDTSFQMGRYGTVYRAFSFKRSYMVAAKIVHHDSVNEQELNLLEKNANMKNHYLMGYYGFVQKGQNTYIFMEICPHGTLRQRLQEPITELQTLKLFRQLVQGMKYLFLQNKIHKDLKPQNILLGPQKDIKICDFGLQKDETSSILETGNLGTAFYSAPQVYFSYTQTQQNHTLKSDVWNSGVILFQMLTGHHPFQKAKNFDQLKDEWLNLQTGKASVQIPSQYHPVWHYLINWMLTFRPQSRPSFQDIYKILNSSYFLLHKEIKSGVKSFPDELRQTITKIRTSQQKYELLLLDLCQTFTKEDIRLRNQFKYAIMFCCMMRYLVFCKKQIPKMQKQTIRSNKEINVPQISKHPLQALLVARQKVVIEQKYYFYRHQVITTIIPKILHDYCQRKQSAFLIKDMDNVIKMVRSMDQCQQQQAEQIYDEGLQSILKVIQSKQGDVTRCYNRSELQIYCRIIMAMLLTERYHQKSQEELLHQDLTKLKKFSNQELIQHIKSLADYVC